MVLIVVMDDKLVLETRRVISGDKRGDGVKNWKSSSSLLLLSIADLVFDREDEGI